MARPIYLEFANAFFHVASRGINRQALFLDVEDSNVFIGILRGVVFKFNLRLFAFCLMTNHYHLYLSTPEANLAKAIKSLNQRYAIYFLRKYRDKDGKVFRDRYMRKLVEDSVYSNNLIAYVHNNPKNLVVNIEQWQYSSYPSYIGIQKKFDFVEYEFAMSHFANKIKKFIDYHDFMRKIDWNPNDYTIAKSFIATEAFVKKITAQYLDLELINNNDVIGVSWLREKPNLEIILSKMNLHNLEPKLKTRIEIFILKEYFGFSYKELSKKYKISLSAITKTNQRFKKTIKAQTDLTILIENILKCPIVRT